MRTSSEIGAVIRYGTSSSHVSVAIDYLRPAGELSHWYYFADGDNGNLSADLDRVSRSITITAHADEGRDPREIEDKARASPFLNEAMLPVIDNLRCTIPDDLRKKGQ